MQADGDIVEYRQVQEEVVILEQGGDRALGGAERQQILTVEGEGAGFHRDPKPAIMPSRGWTCRRRSDR